MQLESLLIYLITLSQTVLAASVAGKLQLPGNLTSRDVEHTKLTLQQVSINQAISSAQKTIFVKSDGSFELTHLAPNTTYVLSASSIDYNLVPYKTRIDITAEDEAKAYALSPGQSWSDSQKIPLTFPLLVFPHGKTPTRHYIVKRSPGILETGPIATVVNNPLYLSGAVFTIALLLMPKIIEYLDPEGVERTKLQQLEDSKSKEAIEAEEKLRSLGHKSPTPDSENKEQSKAEKKAEKKSAKKRKN